MRGWSVIDLIKIRASSLSDIFDCAYRWEATQLLGMRTPMGAPAIIGKSFHAGTAVYDRSYIEGQGLSVDDSFGAAVDAIRKPDEDVAWEDESPDKAEKIVRSLHAKYCTEITPKSDYRAVEITCPKLEISDLGIALTGTTDRVVERDGQYGIRDLKTGKQVVGTDGQVKIHGYAYQLGVYELIAEIGAGLPIRAPAEVCGANTAVTPEKQRIAVSGPISGVRDVLLGDENGPGVLEIASKLIHAGTFPGNPKSMTCHPRYCAIYAHCKYRF